MKTPICNKWPSWLNRLVGQVPYWFLVFLGIAVLGDNDYSLAIGVVPVWIWMRIRDKRIAQLERGFTQRRSDQFRCAQQQS